MLRTVGVAGLDGVEQTRVYGLILGDEDVIGRADNARLVVVNVGDDEAQVACRSRRP